MPYHDFIPDQIYKFLAPETIDYWEKQVLRLQTELAEAQERIKVLEQQHARDQKEIERVTGRRWPRQGGREVMNDRIKKTVMPEYAQPTEEAQQIVRDAINNNSQCFFPDLVRENGHRVSIDVLRAAARAMLNSNEIRLREDSFEHDWEYIFVRREGKGD